MSATVSLAAAAERLMYYARQSMGQCVRGWQ